MQNSFFKIPISVGDITLQVAEGHFATRNSHINYFIDVTEQQSSYQKANAIARHLAQRDLIHSTVVDTILCLDGTRVLGTCLAHQLTQNGSRSVNEGTDIYLLRENVNHNGMLVFRDNARFMLEGKNVLLLLASVTTGGTVRKGIRCIQYYKGKLAGIVAIYSHVKEVDGIPVVSLFDTNDLPDYASYHPDECPMCRQGQPLDAVVDKFGYNTL